jgi:hypothetical protein
MCHKMNNVACTVLTVDNCLQCVMTVETKCIGGYLDLKAMNLVGKLGY